MSAPTALDNIYTRFKKEAIDSRISKLECIQALNDLLFELPITKPAEQFSKIYYIDGFYKYTIPIDFREPIAVYSKELNMIRYVSYLRFRLEEPACAFTDQVDNGKRFLRIRNPLTSSLVTVVTENDSLTADGSWVASGGAGTPTVDTNRYESGGGSIKFNITGTQAILTFTRSSVIDASGFTDKMRERLYAWLPVAPSSIKLRVGNDASNYFEHSITTQASGEKFDTEDVNELEFAENSATETGNVDKTSIDWFQFEFNFSSAVNNDNFALDKIVLAKPEILDFEYYTKYVAIDSSGNLIEKITESDTTTDEPIIKDYDDYINVIIDGLCAAKLQSTAPERAKQFRADYISKQFNGELIGGIEFLKRRYPSRRASYKRVKTLPPLYRNIAGGSRFV